MKFALEVGENEKHRIECETTPLWGLYVIKVDNIERAKVRRMLFAPRREKHSFDIGIQERLQLTVEKVRGIFVGETHRIFLNGRLIKCFPTAKEKVSIETKEAEPVPAY